MALVLTRRSGPFAAAAALAASGLLSVCGQDLFLAQKEAGRLEAPNERGDERGLVEADRPEESLPFGPRCAPLEWIKQDLGSGSWIINWTDGSWGAYMEFLGVDRKVWPLEFNSSDIHQYAFFDNSFILNHTIPQTNFHLLYETPTTGDWVHNPYPAITPTGADPNATVNLTTFRNQFEKPGVPHRDSCWAMRTDMPIISNKSGTNKEYLVTFWRELTSPISMRCSLRIFDVDTGAPLEPWATQMPDAHPFPGYSFRYFRKTVQAYDDVVLRHPCTPTGLRDGTYFC